MRRKLKELAYAFYFILVDLSTEKKENLNIEFFFVEVNFSYLTFKPLIIHILHFFVEQFLTISPLLKLVVICHEGLKPKPMIAIDLLLHNYTSQPKRFVVISTFFLLLTTIRDGGDCMDRSTIMSLLPFSPQTNI